MELRRINAQLKNPYFFKKNKSRGPICHYTCCLIWNGNEYERQANHKIEAHVPRRTVDRHAGATSILIIAVGGLKFLRVTGHASIAHVPWPLQWKLTFFLSSLVYQSFQYSEVCNHEKGQIEAVLPLYFQTVSTAAMLF